ncbi:MAG: hypothetical protein E7164_03290 [Firmicutes bacterium]|nr:hypothetical protein [Bacillota bacterium]
MKKLLFLLIFLMTCGCEINYEERDVNDLIFGETSSDAHADDFPKYHDDNPVILSLYIDNDAGGLDKVGSEYSKLWQLKKDIVVFGSVFSEEDVIKPDYFQNIWKSNASKYTDYQKYKTGWHISFDLLDGTQIDRTILCPSDVSDFYDYLEIYLYDSANVPIGVWYSHLTMDDMTENTILTSMKLTAGSKFHEIDGKIIVSVFTYDTEDDFDENGKYRGNSVYTVEVYNK